MIVECHRTSHTKQHVNFMPKLQLTVRLLTLWISDNYIYLNYSILDLTLTLTTSDINVNIYNDRVVCSQCRITSLV